MADTHIDYREIGEYGRYFLAAIEHLETSDDAPARNKTTEAEDAAQSPEKHLIDISMIRDIVMQAVQAVEADLQRSDDESVPARPRVDTRAVAHDCRDRVRRFYYYLRALPPGAAGDLLAFFPSGRVAALGRLGPDELVTRMTAMLRGFSAPGNLGLVNGAAWRQELQAGRDALESALAASREQGAAPSTKKSLMRGRAHFLRVYHGLAKPAVRALLTYLDRDQEYRRFFLDLQPGDRKSARAV